jgi:hypothetical protein
MKEWRDMPNGATRPLKNWAHDDIDPCFLAWQLASLSVA